MNYRITLEDYLSLINSNELDVFYIYEGFSSCEGFCSTNRSQIFGNSKLNLMHFYHYDGGLNFNEYCYDKFTKKIKKLANGFHMPIPINVVSPTKFTSKVLEITKLKKGDIEALNLFCCSFMEEFKGIYFTLSLWGKVDNVKISDDDGGMWNYIESPELSFLGYVDKNKELLVSYKGERYPYSKFKNLKVFL